MVAGTACTEPPSHNCAACMRWYSGAHQLVMAPRHVSPAGGVVEKNFRAGEMLNAADIVKRQGQFTYLEGTDYVFMVRRPGGACAAARAGVCA